MQLLETRATTEATTDLGEFTALASTWDVDREGDRVSPEAFDRSIAGWKRLSTDMTLLWDHRGGPEYVIGSVDPKSMRVLEQGLFVEGKLDLEDSTMARQAWRSLKANRIGLSFGFTVQKSRPIKGGREFTQIDIYEVSLTATPANPRARVLSWKGGAHDHLRVRREVQELLQPRPAPIRVATFDC
jgi:Escherichia/Staphylococcus phage prohead protease